MEPEEPDFDEEFDEVDDDELDEVKGWQPAAPHIKQIIAQRERERIALPLLTEQCFLKGFLSSNRKPKSLISALFTFWKFNSILLLHLFIA